MHNNNKNTNTTKDNIQIYLHFYERIIQSVQSVDTDSSSNRHMPL